MKCIKCNNLLPDDSDFCQYCGARIKNTADQNNANDSKEKLPVPPLEAVLSTQEKAEPIITAIPASELINNPIELCFIEEDSESSEEAYNNSTETKEEKQVDVEVSRGSNKKQKTRYCKKCGTMIDPKTKKCPNCNLFKKKRFCKNCGAEIPAGEKKCPRCKKEKKSNRIFKVFLGGLAIVTIIALGVFCVYQWMEIDDLQSKNSKLNSEIVSLKATNKELDNEVVSLKTTNKNLSNENKDLQKEIGTLKIISDGYWDMWYKVRFYEEYVVFVPNNKTKKYHTYGCDDFDEDYEGTFWIYSVRSAKADGYKACSKCID